MRVVKVNWWRARVESNRPATNFPGISVDSKWFDCLVEKSGLGVDLRRFQSPIEPGGLGISKV